MNIIFMGTPDFAVGALEAILDAGHKVGLVVTQPDKAQGRSKELKPPAVKQCALKHNLPVFQPERIKKEEAVAVLKQYDADLYVVAAFGQILSKEILDIPKFGCINIHASLLPKYRGAAPIQWAVINGEEKTGVTIQQMNEGVDTGDILLQKEYYLQKDETGESLFDRLCDLGAKAIVEAIEKIEDGSITKTPQNEEESTHAKMLTKAMGLIDFHKSAETIERLVRGLNSWPSAYTFYKGKTMKIWKAEVMHHIDDAKNQYVPGTIVEKDKESFSVVCGDDVLKITEIQLEGKRRMSVKEFLLGCQMETGEVLGK